MSRATWARLVRRLREPSSLAGMSALALLAGATVDAAAHIAPAVSFVLGIAAVFVPEAGDSEP